MTGEGYASNSLLTSTRNKTPARRTTASIIQAIGIALALPASSSEITCVAAAPAAIWLKPVRPDAAPAASGRMLTAPAMQFGSSRPLP